MSPPSLFRHEAIAEAAAPDRYDEALRVMRPWTWAVGASLIALAIIGLVWSSLVDVPVKVAGRGILLPPGGVVDIVSDTDGRIESLMARPGDRVEAGREVARVDQSEVRLQLSLAEGQAADAARQRRELLDFHQREEAAAEAFRVARDAALVQNLRLLEERLGMMREREDVLRGLSQQNLVNRDRALFARVEVFQVREQIAAARNEREQLVLDQALKRTQRERETLEAERRADETSRQAQALRDRLVRLGAVIAPYAGVVVEAKVNEGQVVQRGTPLLTIERDPLTGHGGPVAVVYVSAQDGKRLAEGLRVEVSPSSTRREEHGFIHGRITRVAHVPASSAGLLRTLQNDQLVRSFTTELGTPFEVEVALERNPATRSGMRWSTGSGPDFAIESGTLAEAEFTVRSVRLIGLAFPALRGWLTRTADAAAP
ncbi:NHLP bacteriocin system secretion protein [Falsiroseomonas selenitidurans]|uniref:NHLP bacteriocin system secretion protein n=1 Tax=Falsiroseomonas selenitidurans TaxID=2716335 RepID=A0ABX1E1B3_9PROT|nr:NHLP bacteriocin system secretion protein [Falsiroseomonas selenitidurans]NKC30934.1 NHLP bacteriocin system secretion protein [Falsiroseomonas selenitidurans]